MPSAMSLISSTVLSSTSTGFSFSSIPSTYDDLIVKMSIRGSSERLLMAFNGTTSSNYNLSTFGIALTSLASYTRAGWSDNHLAYMASPAH